MSQKLINPHESHFAKKQLRAFFEDRGFVQVEVQARRSILAACEDPTTIALFAYAGAVWPLPQTGQMWLEYELLTDPSVPGYFCESTSFRQEANPIPGRHDLIFPMFEFEMKGTMDDLHKLNEDLVEHLGIALRAEFKTFRYSELANHYGVSELHAEHEATMNREFGHVVSLTYFPEDTSPFWNMKRDGDCAKKIDVIIHGIETIGSSERSTDPDEMSDRFYSISGGEYSKKLFALCGKKNVQRALENFLSLDFFPRSGGGIGLTRLIRALKLSGQLLKTRRGRRSSFFL